MSQIKNLAVLFTDRAPDPEALVRLAELAGSIDDWRKARQMFDTIRRSALATEDPALSAEYKFIEACLKTLYNETRPKAPFDSIAPFSALPTCVQFALQVGVTLEEIDAACSYGVPRKPSTNPE